MRAITEDDAIRILQSADEVNLDTVKKFRAACKEIDTLTVSRLRPMCDAPKNGKFLVVLNTEDAFHECSFLSDGRVKIGTVAIRVEYCVGWIPKPIYKPEKEC